MKRFLKLVIPAALLVSIASGQDLLNYQFDDTNGTNVNVANNTGIESGSWNFGGPQTQAGSLNLGYTPNFKFSPVDDGTGSLAFRTYIFDSSLTSATYSSYTFDVNISEWDLRQDWDANNDSEAEKGVGFRILESSGSVIATGFETFGTSGFRAFGQGEGASFASVFGGDFDNNLSRFSGTGGTLRISGDLNTGLWAILAKDNEGGAFKTVTSGSGITDIDRIQYFSKSPTVGSWGGASAGFTDPVTEGVDATVGGTAGDYVLIDSMVLSVPEPSSFALIAGALALVSVTLRRRS